MTLNQKPEPVNTPEKSHEKAQRGKLTGLVHAHPEGAALVGRSGSEESPELSSPPEEEPTDPIGTSWIDLIEETTDETEHDAVAVAKGQFDAALLRWSHAVTVETIAGKELDAVQLLMLRNMAKPADVEEADRAWKAALEQVKQTYEALPTVGDLALTMQLARTLTPQGKERATVGLGRALAGVTVETQREMVRNYKPLECAAYATTVALVWQDWEDAENEYAKVQGSKDLAARQHWKAKTDHFRRLMPEVVFLFARNEETRALRRFAKKCDPDQLAWCYFLGDEWDEVKRSALRFESQELADAEHICGAAAAYRGTMFNGMRKLPGFVEKALQKEIAGEWGDSLNKQAQRSEEEKR